MFEETLKSIVSQTTGAVGALIMGLDGISIARAAQSDEAVEIDVIAAEYTTLLRSSIRNSEDASLGALRELAIAADRYSFLIKPITDEYFLVVVLQSPQGIGRARFELRKAQLALEEEFSV